VLVEGDGEIDQEIGELARQRAPLGAGGRLGRGHSERARAKGQVTTVP
jgi:hypothetical protein